MFRFVGIFSFSFVFFLSFEVHSAAWTLNAGAAKSYNSVYVYESSSFFDVQGKERSQNIFQKIYSDNLYEYGYSDDLTLGAKYGYIYQRQAGVGESKGISDLEILARYAIWQGDRNVFSVQPLVKIPLGKMDKKLPLSSGDFDFEFRALLGGGVEYMYNPFFDFELAYSSRGGAFSDEFKFDATLGLEVSDSVDVFLQSFSTHSINVDSISFSNSVPSGYKLTKFQLSVAKNLNKNYTLQAGVYCDVYGENSGKGTGLLFSVWSVF